MKAAWEEGISYQAGVPMGTKQRLVEVQRGFPWPLPLSCCAPAFRAPAVCAIKPDGPSLLLSAPHSFQVLAQLLHLLPLFNPFLRLL